MEKTFHLRKPHVSIYIKKFHRLNFPSLYSGFNGTKYQIFKHKLKFRNIRRIFQTESRQARKSRPSEATSISWKHEASFLSYKRKQDKILISLIT